MRLGGVVILAVGALLLTAGPGIAESIREDAAGHTFRVYALEEDSRHNHFESETSTFTYHQEDRTFGLWVDDQGANVTVTNFTRQSTYDDGTYSADRHTEGAQVSVDGQAAGFTVDQRLQAYVIDQTYDFGSDNQGSADHVIVDYWGNTYGNDARLFGSTGAGLGAGDIVTPTKGDVVFLSGGFYSTNSARAGDLAAGAGGGPSADLFAGDWTGGYVSATVYEVHCQGFDCQRTSVGESLCLLGFRPPFFLECGL